MAVGKDVSKMLTVDGLANPSMRRVPYPAPHVSLFVWRSRGCLLAAPKYRILRSLIAAG